MKVWCVFEDEFPWEGCHYTKLVKIFETEEGANQFMKSKYPYDSEYEKEEWEVSEK